MQNQTKLVFRKDGSIFMNIMHSDLIPVLNLFVGCAYLCILKRLIMS